MSRVDLVVKTKDIVAWELTSLEKQVHALGDSSYVLVLDCLTLLGKLSFSSTWSSLSSSADFYFCNIDVDALLKTYSFIQYVWWYFASLFMQIILIVFLSVFGAILLLKVFSMVVQHFIHKPDAYTKPLHNEEVSEVSLMLFKQVLFSFRRSESGVFHMFVPILPHSIDCGNEKLVNLKNLRTL